MQQLLLHLSIEPHREARVYRLHKAYLVLCRSFESRAHDCREEEAQQKRQAEEKRKAEEEQQKAEVEKRKADEEKDAAAKAEAAEEEVSKAEASQASTAEDVWLSIF